MTHPCTCEAFILKESHPYLLNYGLQLDSVLSIQWRAIRQDLVCFIQCQCEYYLDRIYCKGQLLFVVGRNQSVANLDMGAIYTQTSLYIICNNIGKFIETSSLIGLM